MVSSCPRGLETFRFALAPGDENAVGGGPGQLHGGDQGPGGGPGRPLQGHLADAADLHESRQAGLPIVEGIAPVQVPAAVKRDGGALVNDAAIGEIAAGCPELAIHGATLPVQGQGRPGLPAPAAEGGNDLLVPPIAQHQVRIEPLKQAGQIAQQPGAVRGCQLQGPALPAQGQAVARSQGDEGVPGKTQGQGSEGGRRGELQGKGLLQEVEPPEPAPPSPASR